MNFIISFFTTIFWFLVILTPLVIIHEFGHYLLSRLFGVKIPEFGVGMPLSKRLFYGRHKGTVWSFYPWLLGGFNKIYGDHDALDEANEARKINLELAKQEYLINRLQEIVAGRDLEFFLIDNSLEFNHEFSWFEKIAATGVDEKRLENTEFVQKFYTALYPDKATEMVELETKKQEITSKYKQLEKQILTLIDWEYESKFKNKNGVKDAFFAKNWLQQTLIISGGVIFNTITAIFLFWIIFSFLGASTLISLGQDVKEIEEKWTIVSQGQTYQVDKVFADTPANKAGLKAGDELVSFAGTQISSLNNFEEFRELVQKNKQQETELVYKSKENGEIKTQKVKLDKIEEDRAVFGIGSLSRQAKVKAKDLGTGFGLAIDRAKFITVVTFESLGKMLQALLPTATDRSALKQVNGVVAVSSIGGKVYDRFGLEGILNLMAGLSLGLAIFNSLPIPALDGGRWLILTINRILGRRNKKVEGAVIGITFIILLILQFVIITKDIGDIASGALNSLI